MNMNGDFGPCSGCGASHLIGIELRGVYDGVVVIRCPDCKIMTHRFSGEKVTDEDFEKGHIGRDGLVKTGAKS